MGRANGGWEESTRFWCMWLSFQYSGWLFFIGSFWIAKEIKRIPAFCCYWYYSYSTVVLSSRFYNCEGDILDNCWDGLSGTFPNLVPGGVLKTYGDFRPSWRIFSDLALGCLLSNFGGFFSFYPWTPLNFVVYEGHIGNCSFDTRVMPLLLRPNFNPNRNN